MNGDWRFYQHRPARRGQYTRIHSPRRARRYTKEEQDRSHSGPTAKVSGRASERIPANRSENEINDEEDDYGTAIETESSDSSFAVQVPSPVRRDFCDCRISKVCHQQHDSEIEQRYRPKIYPYVGAGSSGSRERPPHRPIEKSETYEHECRTEESQFQERGVLSGWVLYFGRCDCTGVGPHRAHVGS